MIKISNSKGLKEMDIMAKEKVRIKKEIDKLPQEMLREIEDCIEFLKEKQMKKEWIEFDEWAVNLAKEKGFSHLTEKDISKIVSAYRQSN